MYSHEVIESLKILLEKSKKKNNENFKFYIDSITKLIPQISKSVKFHMGNSDDIMTPFNKYRNKEQRIFMGDLADGIKLPYKNCWFDFSKPDAPIINEHKSSKRGILVFERSDMLDDALDVFIFSYSDHIKMWLMDYVMYKIFIGRNIKDMFNGEHINYFEKHFKTDISPESLERNVIPMPIVSPDFLGMDTYKTSISESLQDISVLNASLMLLSCKNIVTEVVKAPEKLNKKRLKNNKSIIHDYHILKVTAPRKEITSDKVYGESESHYGVHLCRGHFKRFSEEKPLLGKISGRFWWQPQVRGQNKDKMIEKDYNVKVKFDNKN